MQLLKKQVLILWYIPFILAIQLSSYGCFICNIYGTEGWYPQQRVPWVSACLGSQLQKILRRLRQRLPWARLGPWGLPVEVLPLCAVFFAPNLAKRQGLPVDQ